MKFASTAQTINDLNTDIRLNMVLSKHCEWADFHLSDPALRSTVSELKQLHDKHIERIGRSVRSLGGTPAEERRDVPTEREKAASPLKDDQGILSSIYGDEEKLHTTYRDQLVALSDNADVVDLLTRVMSEASDKAETLRLYSKLRM